MKTKTLKQTLEEIYTALVEVGSLLRAIDKGEGDEARQWQAVSALDHRLRRLSKSLPDDVFLQLSCLAGFALSSEHVHHCWHTCLVEVGDLLGE